MGHAIYDEKTDGNCGWNGMGCFLIKEKKLEILKGYKKNPKSEVKGVAERIKEPKNNN